MLRDEIVAYLERYAAAVEAPVREGVDVVSLQPGPDGGFHLETSAGPIAAQIVVLATGGYQRPHRPAGAATLPVDLLQIDVEDYRSPADLPPRPCAGGGERPVGVSDRRGAPRGWPRGLPGLWKGPLGSTPARRSRHRLVGRGIGIHQPARRGSTQPGCPAGRERADERPGRWSRPPPAHAAAHGRHLARPFPGRRGSACPVCARPCRERGVGRCAPRRPDESRAQDGGRAWAAAAGHTRARAVHRGGSRGGGPGRLRRTHLRGRVPAQL